MPANDTILPKDKEALATVVNDHFDREHQRLLPQLTMFRVIWEYLQGTRTFNVIDMATGVVRTHHVNSEGKMEFQGSDLLRAIDRIVGYMGGYDLTNKVYADGTTLGAVRESAVGQVVSDSIYSSQDIDRAATEFLYIFASLGSCGIAAHVEDNPAQSVGMTADIEVVHPCELVPFPSVGMDISRVRGLGRQMYVPLSKLEMLYGRRKMRNELKNMYWFEVKTGEDPQANRALESPSGWWKSESLTNESMAGQYSEDQEITAFVRVRELWLDGPRGTCSRKVCVSGKVVLQDLDFEGVEAYCPIGFARFMENGTFYGAGMYHVLFSLARGLETMMKSVFQETIDRERYGYLVMPQGSFNVNQTLKEVGKGLRVLPWEPDGMVDGGQRPFIVQPNNTGDAPTKVAVFAKQYFDAINPLVDVIKEKGRVDSASGLEFLQEQVDRAMTSPTKGVVKAWGQMYKAGLAKASQLLTQGPRAIPVTRLTLDLAGAVIDWERNEVKFPSNPLPSVSRLRCVPRLGGNRSKAQRKGEAWDLVKTAGMPPLQAIIKGIEEGWDLALWLDKEESAYKTGVMDILTLYNDGQEPGMLMQNPHFVRPDVQLMLLDAFMGSPKMKVASPEVQGEFIAFRKFLIEQSGRTLPEGMPYNPDDMAVVMAGQDQASGSLPRPQI